VLLFSLQGAYLRIPTPARLQPMFRAIVCMV